MPSPVGHCLGGIAVYLAGVRIHSRSKVWFGLLLFASVLPDFDFLPGLLIGDAGAFHHGASHSFTWAMLFGTLVYVSITLKGHQGIALRAGMLTASAYALHVALDMLGASEGNGKGVPIFWPLSDQQYSSNLHLLGQFHHENFRRGIWSVLQWGNVSALLRELVVVGSPVVLIAWWEWATRFVRTERFWKTVRNLRNVL